MLLLLVVLAQSLRRTKEGGRKGGREGNSCSITCDVGPMPWLPLKFNDGIGAEFLSIEVHTHIPGFVVGQRRQRRHRPRVHTHTFPTRTKP
jgi:hypothetical protein